MNDHLSQIRMDIDAPEPIIVLATVDAMRDFCHKCDAWLHTFRTAVKDTSLSYNLLMPMGSELIAVKSVDGASGSWSSDGISRVTFTRQPATETLTITMRLKPTLGVQEIPTPLSIYGDALRAGTLMRLYGMRGTDWHDPEEYMRWQQDYMGQIGDARIRQAQSHADGIATVRPPMHYRIGRRGRSI